MSQPNRVVIALCSIFGGAATGGVVATFFVWAAWQQWPFLSVLGDLANTVFVGWGVGAITAFVVSWRLSGSLYETWRRAAMAVTASIGTVGVGAGAQGVGMASMMSMSAVASWFLPAYGVVSLAVAFFAFRLARKQRTASAA